MSLSALLLLTLQVAPYISDQEEIIITGTRTPVRVAAFASPVSILTSGDLEARQFVRVIDALQTLPGVSVTRSGTGGQAQLRLRGAESNHILVLIDGVEVNDAAAGDEFQFEHLSPTDIERIELIRGPQSASWGSDALAGVLTITTKKESGGTSGNLRTEAGSFGTYRVGGSARTSGDGWYIGGGADWLDSRGVSTARPKTGNPERDGYENFSLNLHGGAAPSERFKLDATLRYEDTRTEADATSFITGLPADSDNVSFTKKLTTGVSAAFDVVPGFWQQTARVTYLDSELDNRADGTFDGSTASEKWGFYADTRLTLTPDHKLTLFIDHEDTDFIQRGAVGFFGDPNQNQSRDVTGFGADFVGELVGEFDVNLSVRRDDNSAFRNFTSWKAGFSARIPISGTRFFGSVARGQKAPTFTEQFGFFAAQFQGNPNLRPERSTQYEIGLEQSFGRGFSVSLTGFTTRLRDEINGFVFQPNGLATALNTDGRSRRDGFEFAFDAKLLENLSLTGHYSYVRSREAGAAGLIQEIRRPKHQAFLGTVYKPVDKLTIALDLDYTGRAFDLFFQPSPPFAAVRTRLGGYLQVRLATTYRLTDQLELTARVENLLNEDYEDILGFNTPGMGAYGGLRFRF